MRLRSLFALSLVLPFAAFAQAEPPADFFDTFNRLSILVDQEELSPMDFARGSMLASQFFSVGAPGLPKAQSWFSTAPTRGRASMSGMFLAIHGKQEHLDAVQRELETNRTKREWLYELVGTAENFNIAMENGETWKPLMRALPSTAGCRALALSCMQSRDALVRRTGLYWGYWFATPSYWAAAEKIRSGDPDPLARRMAEYLAHSEKKAAASQ